MEAADYSSLAGSPRRPAGVVMLSTFAQSWGANELRTQRSETTVLKGMSV